MPTKLAKFAAFWALFLGLVSCQQNNSTFANYPGFAEYFALNKPATTLPSAEDQALLRQYRPRIYLAEQQSPFISFYQDYIAHGTLYNDGKIISDAVDQSLLNEYKDLGSTEFRYQNNDDATTSTLYARISRETLEYEDKVLELTFLRYNLVFATSGVPKGISTWQRAIIGLIGNNADWHQLDHYVGLTIALYEDKPIAVMLQQHNYQTTWLLTDKTIASANNNTLMMPADNRIAVDVAMQSNELYPHSPEQVKHPSVSFIKVSNLAFIKEQRDKPFMASWDITHGQIEQDYTLSFLAPADAFYTFKGSLGKYRLLPGRDGPPGANYVQLPPLLPFKNQLVTGYRPRDVATEAAKLSALFSEESFSINPAGIAAYQRDFMADWAALEQSSTKPLTN